MRRRPLRSWFLAVTAVVPALVLAPAGAPASAAAGAPGSAAADQASADERASVLPRFAHSRTLTSWATPAFAESMAADGHGGYLVSVTTWSDPAVGQLWRVRAGGGRSAFGPPIPLGPCSMLLGVVAARDTAYVAVYDYEGTQCAGRSEPTGILRVTPSGLSRVTTLPAGSWPNGVLLLRDRLYVTDSAAGAVWRVPRDGGTRPAKPWFTSSLLRGTGEDHPIGANGIAYHDGVIYVASAAQGLVLELVLDAKSQVRQQSVLARDSRLVSVDGITVDRGRRVWAAVNTGALVRVSPDGSVEPVQVPAGTFDYPTQPLVEGDGEVIVTNGSFDAGTPSVVALVR
jgi:sugar lactone lactonase YvrE